MNPNKVLWPIDFSRNVERALPYIASLIEQENADVHVLHVIHDIARHEPWYGEYNESRVAALTERETKSVVRRLEQLCEKYLDSCVLFTRHTAVGDPAEEILKLVDRENMQMVVMGKKDIEDPVYRERTTDKVKRLATVPVREIPI